MRPSYLFRGSYIPLHQVEPDTKSRIEEWLDEEGVPFESVPDINSKFHVVAQMKNMQIHVRESNVRVGCIVIEGIMSLDEGQLELIRKIKEEERGRHSLFLKFFRELDQEEYLFQLSRDFLDPTWLRIQRILYAEDMSRTALLDGMKNLNTRFVRINYELNAALDNMSEPPSSSSSSSLYR